MTHICSNPRDVLIATARAMAETAGHPDHKAEWAALATELDSGRPDGAEPQGTPVDGREVDQAPEDYGHTIPIPGPVSVGHWWLRTHPKKEACYCLIGADHVSEPRFSH